MTKQSDKLPKVAQYKPYYEELTKGRTYLWCSCGLSKRQPFCDGSHIGTDFEPVKYVAQQEGEEVLFCGCKQSGQQPFCDGTHNNLLGGYEQEDPNTKANLAIPVVAEYQEGRAHLNGQCYVVNIDKTALAKQDNISWGTLITEQTGAVYQSAFYFVVEANNQHSSVVSFADSETIILVAAGEGEIIISGEAFKLTQYMGAYVRAGEVFSLKSNGKEPLKLYLSVCSHQNAPSFSSQMSNDFDDNFPDRMVAINSKERHEMGDRYFQILVNKEMGSSMVTQFIGEISQSMSAFHRHLYEEVLVILGGEGYMWTDNLKTAVKTGDVIFLPSKQKHSLQCTSPKGLLVAGVIYPGDNPSINY